MINIYYLIAIFAAFFLAIANNFVKKTTIGNSNFQALATRTFFSTAIIASFIGISSFFGSQYSINFPQFSLAFLYSFLGFLGLLYLYKSVEGENVSTVFPIINANAVGVLFFGVILFGNTFAPINLFGIVIILLGIILITIDFSNLRKINFRNKNVIYAFLVWIFWGVALNGYSKVGQEIGTPLMLLITESTNLIASILSIIFLKIKLQKISTPTFLYTLLIALAILIGFGLQVYAQINANPGIISSIVAVEAIFTVFIASRLYNERVKPVVYFGAFMVFIGIALINLLK
jgi:drug/metabolite transporter (DMT)-like permease